MWIRDVIAHDLGRRAPFIDVVAPGCARVLISAFALVACFGCFKFFQAHPVFILGPPLVPSLSTLRMHSLGQSRQLALWHNVLAATCWL